MKNWFKEWFDSSYCDDLYRERDVQEADLFIDSLMLKFAIGKDCKVLDVACGNGRHAKALFNRGISVTGLDISFKKIANAKKFENQSLSFYQHDMRKMFRINYFDYVLNLFTSFGYFEKDRENHISAVSLATNLKKNGILIIDYFNKSWIENNIISMEEIEILPNVYEIWRTINQGRLIKDIRVCSAGKCEQFQERVRIYSKNEFVSLFESVGLQLTNIFGNYDLEEFDEHNSPRMICAFIKL